MELTQEQLKELLDYDPETGIFTWKSGRSNKSKDGRGLWRSEAGWVTLKGYIAIEINGRQCMAHRLAWLYIHGMAPYLQIDHVNLDKADNRISNLRLATQSQNQHNTTVRRTNKLGVKGVYLKRFESGNVAYATKICVNRKVIHIGYFSSIEEAKAAYDKASLELRGEFSRANI